MFDDGRSTFKFCFSLPALSSTLKAFRPIKQIEPTQPIERLAFDVQERTQGFKEPKVPVSNLNRLKTLIQN